MGNRQSKQKPEDASSTKKGKEEHVPSAGKEPVYTYAETLRLIEVELMQNVPVDLSGVMLSFIPRSVIGDELVMMASLCLYLLLLSDGYTECPESNQSL